MIWAAEGAALVIALAGTVLGRWQAKDLIWGLWISSLCVGYAWIVTAVVASMLRPRLTPGLRAAAVVGGLFLLAFFTVHFGGFHLGHSVFLNVFFPLDPLAGRDPFTNAPRVILLTLNLYWPVVLASFVSRLPDFPWRGVDMKEKNAMMAPYANVVRMHLLIFVFAGLAAAKLSDLAVYPVLLFYFVPWGLLFRKRATESVEERA